MVSKRLTWLVALFALTAASGANCTQLVQQYTQPIPRALPPNATLAQVMSVVNDNSARIHSFYSTRSTISTPGLPSLRANMAFERMRNFRLRADTMLTGPEVDLGSNDELFWFWVRRNQPPALYFCRHDQFAASPARRIIPIEPQWLVESLGIMNFDPAVQHQGPFPVSGGRLEIRSPQPGPSGALTRITVVDESGGVVLEQHLYDPQGSPLASARLSRHMRDPASGVTMPRHVTIQWPPAKFELTIDMEDLQINQLPGSRQELFSKPVYPGYAETNLCDPNLQLAPPMTAIRPQRMPPTSFRY